MLKSSLLKGTVTHSPYWGDGVSRQGCDNSQHLLWGLLRRGWGCRSHSRIWEGTCVCPSSWTGPGIMFTGGNAPANERGFTVVFLIVLHAAQKVRSVSPVGISPGAAQREHWYLQISSCFVFHFLSHSSSWLPFPCESTFILKLLP